MVCTKGYISKGTNRELLLALLLGTTELLDGGQCGVGVERPQDISDVEGIDLAAAVEVVDREGEGCPWMTISFACCRYK